ncbi:hypothetical protein GMMP15_1930017 [Candidatus Magnetomoraceae bacterium gMMP-15]
MSDFKKEWRPQGGYFDIGTDEFYKGEMIPDSNFVRIKNRAHNFLKVVSCI